jgi:VanZ family protein
MQETASIVPFHKDKLRVLSLIAAVLWAAAIFWVSSIPGSGLPGNIGMLSNVAHFLEYMMLSALIASTCRSRDKTALNTVLIAVAAASLYGVSDEFHQWFVEGRFTDVFDWLTDTVGAIVGAVGFMAIVAMLGAYPKTKRRRERPAKSAAKPFSKPSNRP